MKLFLETSALIRRALTRRGRRILRQAVGDGTSVKSRFATAYYCIMEIRRTIVDDVLFVRDCVSEVPAMYNGLLRLSDIDEELGSANIFSKRRCQRMYFVTAAIKRHFPREEYVPAKALSEYLTELAQEWMNQALRKPGTQNATDARIERTNFTECCAFDEMDELRQGAISCNKRNVDCAVDDLMEKHCPLFEEFLGPCGAYSDDRLINILGSFLEGEIDTLRGQRTCWYVADALIALEALEWDATHLVSYDRRFQSLCECTDIGPMILRD